jgi:hypothetical protein
MVKLLKSGSWALEGVRVVEMVEGVDQSFGAAEDFKLVEAGWAEWVKVVPVAEAEVEPEAAEIAAKTKAK